MERKPEVIHIVGNNLRFSLGFYIFTENTVCGQQAASDVYKRQENTVCGQQIWAKLLLWDGPEPGFHAEI